MTWSYLVTNTGMVPLTNIVVTDDNGTPANTADDFVVGTIPGPLAPGASATLTHHWGGDPRAVQQHCHGPVGGHDGDDDVHGLGHRAGLLQRRDAGHPIVKLTNGTDNDSPTGPFVPVGSTVTWTYNVTNTGNVTLTDVTVTDDNGTPGNTADDFHPTSPSAIDPQPLDPPSLDLPGQRDRDGRPVRQRRHCRRHQRVAVRPSPTPTPTTTSARRHLDIVKLTNGTDNDSPTGPFVPVGSTVTWTYTSPTPATSR